MIIQTVVETSVDIANVIRVFKSDDSILRIVENKFVGKCFHECFIKKVISVERRSRCVINQEGAPNHGRLTVTFRIRAVVYIPGEIIADCRVITKKGGSIICRNKYADIYLLDTPDTAAIQAGNIIPVRANMARYSIGESRISVNASLNMPTARYDVYEIVLPISVTSSRMLAAQVRKIAIAESKAKVVASESEKAWTVFKNIMYAYKTPQKRDNVMNIVDLLNNATTDKYAGTYYIGRDPGLDLTTPVVIMSKQAQDGRVPLVTSDAALIAVANHYIGYLRALRTMVRVYNTPEMLDGHANLWRILNAKKM